MKKRFVIAVGVICLIALKPASGKAAAGKAAAAKTGLIGAWNCQSANGAIALTFKNKTTLVYDGQEMSYALAAGAIRVPDEAGNYIDYRYTLSGNSLEVSMPDRSTLNCKRASAQTATSDKKGAGGGESLIFGTFCSWSGSSTGSSSYSSSGRAAFDGKGNFSYGSQSSFSSTQGMYYGHNPGTGNRGTYRVNGNTLTLSFGDGTTASAQIHFRQTDGSVSEIMYNKALYGKALCQ